MLNEARVLDYVKSNLGWPFMHLELTDEKILEYIKDHTRSPTLDVSELHTQLAAHMCRSPI